MLLKRLGLLFLPLWMLYAQSDTNLNLESLLQQVLSGNPQLQALASQASADSARVPQVGSLPDPMLSLNMLNLPTDNFVFDQEAMTGKQIALKQSFPFPGKLGLKESAALSAAAASTANWHESRARLTKETKTTWFNLYFTDQAISTTQKNILLIQEFVTIAEKKYSVGSGLQQDVLKAQVELSRMQEQLLNLLQQRQQIVAAINTLRYHAVNEPIGPTGTLAAQFNLPQQDSLYAYALNHRNLLKASGNHIKSMQAQLDLAKKDYLPDFSLFAAYTQRETLQSGMGGVDFLSGGISLNLPLYFHTKQDKQVQEQQARLIQVRSADSEIRSQIARQLDDALSSLDRNQKLFDLYSNGIIPQAAQSLQSAMTGYQTNKVDFLTLINNQKTLFNYELQISRILSAINKDVAQLEFVTGYYIPQ